MSCSIRCVREFISFHKKGIILLTLVFVLAYYLRLMTYPRVFVDGNVVLLEADPYYHLRRIIPFTLEFPRVFLFDNYFNYPYGSGIGWPPLFDQVIAVASLILGLGKPDIRLIGAVAAHTPALLGAITIIPLFFMTRLLFNWKTGIIAALFLAVLPAHLQISQLGFTDHHAAELLLSLFAYTLFLASMKYPEKNSIPILSGATFALLMLLWLGSPVFIAIILTHAVLWFTLCHYQRVYTKTFAGKGFNVFATATIITLAYYLVFPGVWQPSILQTTLSLFQPLLLIATALAYPILGQMSKSLGDKNKHFYPASIIVLSLLGVVFLKILSPGMYNSLLWGVSYIDRSDTIGQVIEALPLFYTFDKVFTTQVAWNIFTTTLITTPFAIVLLAKERFKRKMDCSTLFFFTWTAIIFLLALKQRRFSYLAAANVAILTGYLLHAIYEKINSKTRAGKTSTPQEPAHTALIALLIITLLLAAPNVTVAKQMAERPLQITPEWYETLQWIQYNTPQTTNWSTPENMPEYSIMAWWDYGNWIIYIARRPVVANNFQTGAIDSTRFFLSRNESTSNRIMEERGSKYVIADYRLGLNKFMRKDQVILGGTFFAATYLLGENAAEYLDSQGEPNQKYYNTTYAKLHLFDGKNLSHYRLIHESRGIRVNLFRQPTPNIKIFQYVKGATISGHATPDTTIAATLPVTTNVGRTFTYVKTTTTDSQGNFNITVPYPTENKGAKGAGNNYTILAGTATTTAHISEKDVIEGNTIRVGKI